MVPERDSEHDRGTTGRDSKRLRVAIAGASGFVGRAIRRELKDDFDIVALTRRASASSRNETDSEGVVWRTCDLFDDQSVSDAFTDVDIVIYLVHSMSPQSRLTQGGFIDLDLVLAHNVRRAADRAGVRRIVFLGGLDSDLDESRLSPHLASRREVGIVLKSGRAAFTELRAGLIIGRGGSSFRMLMRLIRRLPVMVLPRWTSTPTQPIAIADVQRAVRIVLSDDERWIGGYDLGIPEELDYGTMIRRAAGCIGRSPVTIPVPISSPRISTLWIMLFSGEPGSLVIPLIASLSTPTVARPNPLLDRLQESDMIGFETAISEALADHGEREDPRAIVRRRDRRVIHDLSLVRSIQRVAMPSTPRPDRVSRSYWRWVGRLLPGLLRVKTEIDDEGRVAGAEISLLGCASLLVLKRDDSRCDEELETLSIVSGLLVRRNSPTNGRFEFRTIRCRGVVVTALQNFAPSLPWFVYQWSQAIVHRIVMWGFSRWLRRNPDVIDGE